MSNFLGRCKDCDYAIFAAASDIKEADNAIGGGPAVNVGNGQIMARCTNGHRWFKLSKVKGTYSEKHQCDSRCLNAKGHNCTCSCGGANHGRGHAVTVTQVTGANNIPSAKLGDEDPSPYRRGQESTHVGEVGKHIRGEVKVVQAKEGNRPYKFVTGSGAELVWFVPESADPGWKKDEKIFIRAKVKAHNDHPQFGKSTVVIYVEEV